MNWTILTSYKAMHETKSPHVNHIHQYKSHNTIDLDLQSLYSISIRKYYNDIVCSKLFSQSSKLTQNGRELSYLYTRVKIPRRRAHGISKEGAPCGKSGAAKCGRGLPPLPHSTNVKPKSKGEEGAPPLESVGCHLKGAPPLQEGRTSQ
jgi:hypothetical protein